MDNTAIQRIVELGAPNIVSENGYTYSDKALSIIGEPNLETIKFRTLKGLVDTLHAEYKRFRAPTIINVSEYNQVIVRGAISPIDRSRDTPYRAEAETPNIEFSRYCDYESMMITLKSKFVETPELLELIKLLGSITEENSATVSDDGFTQSAVVRKGIAMKENKVINPIIRLKPRRTFIEVEQPESEFLLRLREGAQVALFEADGGAWKLEARKNIADYLRDNLDVLIKKDFVLVVE